MLKRWVFGLGVLACLFASLAVNSTAAHAADPPLTATWPEASFGTAHDADCAPDGTVYVVDPERNSVHRFTADGHRLASWGATGSATGQFLDPTALATAPDGTVYVVDRGNNRIQHFSALGEYLGSWGGYGSAAGKFVTPDGIDVSSDGTVYVSDTGNSRIQVFGAEGAPVAQWGLAAMGWSGGDPAGLAVRPDGSVWVALRYGRAVLHIDSNGNRVASFTDWSAGFSWRPEDVDVAPDGSLLVADTSNNRIQRWASAGILLGTLPTTGNGFPTSVNVIPDGSMFVAQGNRQIDRFAPDGAHLSDWGPGSSAGLRSPWHATVNAKGEVLVADRQNSRVQRFSATGRHLGSWGTPGTGDGQFIEPSGVSCAPDGTVYVVDSYLCRVQRFSESGTYLGGWGTSGGEIGQFRSPADICVGPDGSVYVADLGNGRVQRFTSSGSFLCSWSSYSGGMTSISPTGLAVGPDGTVYVTAIDWYYPVQSYSATGSALFDRFIRRGSLPGMVLDPSAIAVTPGGDILVADTANNRVQQFRGRTLVRAWGGPGTDPGQFMNPKGIAVFAGTVYVVDSDNNRIQVFEPDLRPPVSMLHSDHLGVWAAASATFTLDASDPDGSQVAATYYRVGSEATQTYSGASVEVRAEGETRVEYWSVDLAGNEELPHKVATITIDASAPQSLVDVRGVFTGVASIPIASADTRSGVASQYWRIDGGPWQTGATASASGVGAHTLEYYAVDAVGNEELPHKLAPFVIQDFGRVSGTITNAGVAQARVVVGVFDATTHAYVKGVFTDALGSYALTGLVPGSYHVRFTGTTPASLSQYSDHKGSIGSATVVSVGPGATTIVSSDLAPLPPVSGAIAGSITATGAPLARVVVGVFDAATDAYVKAVFTDAAGGYAIPGLPPGSYHVRFTGTTPAALEQYFDHAAGMASAANVVVSSATTTTVTSDLAPRPQASGLVTGIITVGEVPQGRIVVSAFDAATHAHVKGVFTDAAGAYSISGLAPGIYHLRFTGTTPASLGQYFDHGATISSATTITVGSGLTVTASSDLAQ